MPERSRLPTPGPSPVLLEQLRLACIAAWHLGYAQGIADELTRVGAGEREYASWFVVGLSNGT